MYGGRYRVTSLTLADARKHMHTSKNLGTDCMQCFGLVVFISLASRGICVKYQAILLSVFTTFLAIPLQHVVYKITPTHNTMHYITPGFGFVLP